MSVRKNLEKKRYCWIAYSLTVTLLLPSLQAIRIKLTDDSLSNAELRSLQMDKTRLARQVQTLLPMQLVLEQESKNPTSAESLHLDVLETFSDLEKEGLIDVIALHLKNIEPASDQLRIDALIELRFTIRTVHEITLLSLFSQLEELMGWRPVEARSCTVSRSANSDALHSSCVLHLYHWNVQA